MNSPRRQVDGLVLHGTEHGAVAGATSVTRGAKTAIDHPRGVLCEQARIYKGIRRWGPTAFRCLALDWPGPALTGGLLLCVAKEVTKKGDPASPVVGFADDSLALLATRGRRRTRPLRGLRQLRRTSPPVVPLLSGSAGALRMHRAFTEAACVSNAQNPLPTPHSPLLTSHPAFSVASAGGSPYHSDQIDRQHLQHSFQHAPHALAPGRPAPQPRHKHPESHRPGLRWHRKILRWPASFIACRRAATGPCRSAVATRRPKILYRHFKPGWRDSSAAARHSDLFSCHAAIFYCLLAIP